MGNINDLGYSIDIGYGIGTQFWHVEDGWIGVDNLFVGSKINAGQHRQLPDAVDTLQTRNYINIISEGGDALPHMVQWCTDTGEPWASVMTFMRSAGTHDAPRAPTGGSTGAIQNYGYVGTGDPSHLNDWCIMAKTEHGQYSSQPLFLNAVYGQHQMMVTDGPTLGVVDQGVGFKMLGGSTPGNYHRGINVTNGFPLSLYQSGFATTDVDIGADWERGRIICVDDVFQIGTDAGGTGTKPGLRFSGRISSAAAPTTTEFPSDEDWGIHIDTVSGDISIAANDDGTIVKATLT